MNTASTRNLRFTSGRKFGGAWFGPSIIAASVLAICALCALGSQHAARDGEVSRLWNQGLDLMIGSARADQHWAFVAVEKSRGLPVRGQSRSSVRKQFGEPAVRKGAVGRPPISTWIYQDFTVYFEHNLVITTVASKDYLPGRLNDIQ